MMIKNLKKELINKDNVPFLTLANVAGDNLLGHNLHKSSFISAPPRGIDIFAV